MLYRFIQVKPERYFGAEKVWIGEVRVTITDPERTLLDGLSMPQYCGDFAEVLHAFEVRGEELDLKRIIDYALKLDAVTAKRLGWVLEQLGVEPVRLEMLVKLPIRGYRKLDPTGPRRGPCNRRWMIQENLPGKLKG
jgi:predicted transcriptional regulator of viral defense system